MSGVEKPAGRAPKSQGVVPKEAGAGYWWGWVSAQCWQEPRGGVFQPPAAAALGLSLLALHYREPHHVLHAGLPDSGVLAG